MSSMFDVDCPRTPDGEDDDNRKKVGSSQGTKPPKAPSSGNRPPRPGSSATPRGTLRKGSVTPRSTMRKQGFSPMSHARKSFSPRIRGSSRKSAHNVGLEPEEYIAPIPNNHPSLKPPRAPNSGGASGVPPRAPNSGPGAYQAAPSSGNGGDSNGEIGNRRRTHSTEAFGGNESSEASTNPFDEPLNGNRRRTDSGNWWGEEIVNESHDKEEVAQKYYGLNPREKQELYGPTTVTTQPAAAAAASANTNANKNAQGHQGGIAPQGMPAQHQQQQQLATGSAHHGILIQQNPKNNNNNPNLNTNIYQQASSMNNAGQYSSATAVVDDYSFSNVNLSSPGHGGMFPPGNFNRGSSHGMMNGGSNHGGKTTSIRDQFVQKWNNMFAPGKKHEGYIPPNMAPETNIAPPLRGSSNEWYPNSPKVTFMNDFPSDGIRKKKNGFWYNLSPSQKMGVGLVWVALVCTIFGVTISEFKKFNATNASGSGSQVQGMPFAAEPTPWPDTEEPTLKPTPYPTERPTTRPPTRDPVTASPVAGYYAVHSKAYDGTIHPTRSPITASPSGSPTPKPTEVPTEGPTEAPTVLPESVQVAPERSCNDEDGFFANHLLNLKNCAWLDSKPGFTDRKDKNCGGRPVSNPLTGGTIIYQTSELGNKCRRACGMYNGCTTEEVTQQEVKEVEAILGSNVGGGMAITPFKGNNNNGDYIRPSPVSQQRPCQDSEGLFLNHLLNQKTCEWLYNDKPGQTDRKDKNCGFANYPVTQLGQACRKTCGLYHPKRNGCEMLTMMNNGHIMRSFSSPSYSFSVTSPSTACVNGEGTYLDHKNKPKKCSWLLGDGNNDNEYARHRQEKNCVNTELGRMCPWSCRKYNDCGS